MTPVKIKFIKAVIFLKKRNNIQHDNMKGNAGQTQNHNIKIVTGKIFIPYFAVALIPKYQT